MGKVAISSEQGKVVQSDQSRQPGLAHLHESTHPLVRIHLLGTMRATSFLGSDILLRGKKAQALLGYLALAPGKRASRSRVAAMLWDNVPDDQARASLRQALREIFSAMGSLADEMISADRETITLNANLCWIDAAAIFAPQIALPTLSHSDFAALCTGDSLRVWTVRHLRSVNGFWASEPDFPCSSPSSCKPSLISSRIQA